MKKWATSMKEAADMLGVDQKIIKNARSHPACNPSFGVNGRIDVKKLGPLLKVHLAELQAGPQEDTEDYWDLRKKRAAALLAEIQLDEAKKKYLLREEVLAYIKRVALAQKATLRSRLVNELPPRLLGLGITEMTVILDKEINDICNLFQTQQIK